MTDFASVGPERGSIMFDDGAGVIDVRRSPDNPVRIGAASCVGRNTDGVALWNQYVHNT